MCMLMSFVYMRAVQTHLLINMKHLSIINYAFIRLGFSDGETNERERKGGRERESARTEIIPEIIPTEYAPNDYQTDAMFICK